MTAEVSVIIAAFNVENYIERAIRSALEWQGVAVEVIVVNDGSTDRTAEIVTSIGDERVKRLNLPGNGGPARARNAGFEIATTPWVAILDGDDAFLPDHLLHCLTRAKAIAADIVVDNITVHREADGSTYPMFEPTRFSRLSMLDLATFIDGNNSFLGGEALGYLKPMFRLEFLRRHNLRYDENLRVGEDYMLMCDALANGARCGVVGTAGYLYTVRKGSISHRLSLTDVERIEAGDKKFLAHYKLDRSAALAQKRREYALKEAFAYTRLVDAIKQKDLKAALHAATECPTAVWGLWRPVWVRLARLAIKTR